MGGGSWTSKDFATYSTSRGLSYDVTTGAIDSRGLTAQAMYKSHSLGHDLVCRINDDTNILRRYGIDASTSLAVTHTNEYALENLTRQMIFSNSCQYKYRLYTSDNEATLNMEGDS